METLYCHECCPECGHLLTNDRTMCSFCNWYNLDNPVNEQYRMNEAPEGWDFLCALPQNEVSSYEAVI